jgi:signal transduction histidine kinase
MRHTLLVVDDEPDVVKSVQDLLRLEYKILTATRAVDGMKLMEEHEVHVVMTDQRMPGVTGVELLHKIRGEHPEAIRLLFTGYADIRAVIDAINQGNVYRYVTKPWDPEELQTIIREACERYDLLAERKKLLSDLIAKNEQLAKANRELHDANALKTAFIQVSSHELRTPLTILLGLSDLLSRAPGLSEATRGWIDQIKGASDRLMHLVNQIVTMLSAGKFDKSIQKQLTDLPDLLTLAVNDVRPFIELRKQTIVCDWPKDLGKVPLEPLRMRDSINHLLMNAIKFTPDSGQINIAAKRTADGGAQITVSDTGLGIEPDCVSHLFEPFFTGFDVERHSSGQFEYGRKGLGLGLSLVKEFVTSQGGTLDVTSQPGSGTRFTITLPGN